MRLGIVQKYKRGVRMNKYVTDEAGNCEET